MSQVSEFLLPMWEMGIELLAHGSCPHPISVFRWGFNQQMAVLFQKLDKKNSESHIYLCYLGHRKIQMN